MLTSVSSSVEAASALKLISIPGSNFSGNAIVYTVPQGKIFKGHLFARGADSINIVINGSQIQISHSPQTAPTQLPLTLPEGTVVRNPASSYSYWLVGVEE